MAPRVYLTREDAGRNMARYYLMDVQTTLFGEWSLVREWGRIDRAGQVRIVVFPTEAAALKAMETIEIAKVRKGYHIKTSQH